MIISRLLSTENTYKCTACGCYNAVTAIEMGRHDRTRKYFSGGSIIYRLCPKCAETLRAQMETAKSKVSPTMNRIIAALKSMGIQSEVIETETLDSKRCIVILGGRYFAKWNDERKEFEN